MQLDVPPADEALELTLQADPDVLAGLRAALGRWLAEIGASGEERQDVVLAATEAAANAIEHACGAGRGSFEVRCELRAETVRIAVRDEGCWQSAPSRSGGRGLEIMRALMDSIEIDRGGRGTTVTLARRLAVAVPAGGAPGRAR